MGWRTFLKSSNFFPQYLGTAGKERGSFGSQRDRSTTCGFSVELKLQGCTRLVPLYCASQEWLQLCWRERGRNCSFLHEHFETWLVEHMEGPGRWWDSTIKKMFGAYFSRLSYLSGDTMLNCYAVVLCCKECTLCMLWGHVEAMLVCTYYVVYLAFLFSCRLFLHCSCLSFFVAYLLSWAILSAKTGKLAVFHPHLDKSTAVNLFPHEMAT